MSPQHTSRSRQRPRWLRDDGVGLVEVIVALTIAAVVLLSLAAALLNAVGATTQSRANQQAGDLLAQEVERVRALEYGSLANRPAEIAGAPGIGGTLSAPTYAPPNLASEPLAVDAVGAVSPFSRLVNNNNTAFTVRRYLTNPASTNGPQFKRLTVVVTWTDAGGQARTRAASTLLSEVVRGLPLPRFRVQGSPVLREVAQGAEASFGLRVDNLGARDAFALSSNVGAWTYYVDDNKNGIRDASEVQLAPDSNGDGVADSGLLEPNAVIHLVAVRVVGATETGAIAYNFIGTSIAQPAAPTAVATTEMLTLSIVTAGGAPTTPGTPSTGAVNSPSSVPAASCDIKNKCLPITYYTEAGLEGATTTETYSVLRENQQDPQLSLSNYSNELAVGTQGRHLATTGEARYLQADWRYAIPFTAATKNKAAEPQVSYMPGTAVVRVYVQCYSPGASIGLTAVAAYATSGTGAATQVGSGTTSVANCPSGSFHPVDIGMTVTAVPPTASHLVLQVKLANGSQSDVRLAYDVSTAAGYLQIPRSN